MKPKLSDIVYLKTGSNKEAHIITAILRRNGSVQYELTFGKESSWHAMFEFTTDKPSEKQIRGLR